jgi:hypothetical protein
MGGPRQADLGRGIESMKAKILWFVIGAAVCFGVVIIAVRKSAKFGDFVDGSSDNK